MSTLRVAADTFYRGRLARLPAEVRLEWFDSLAGAVDAASDAEVLALGPDRGWPVADVVVSAPHLRWVHTRAAGVDRGQMQPLQVFRDRGITVTNGSGISSVPIAEYVVMAMLAISRGLPGMLAAQGLREWVKPAATRELAGSHLLLLGFGDVGRTVWDRLQPFGVIGTAVRRWPGAESGPEIVGPAGWRPRLGEFDWVVATTPLNRETRHLVGERELAAMQQHAWLINVSRGGVVDQRALTTALRRSDIGGAWLDVTDPEPLPPDDELWSLPNAVITPHSSWQSPRFAERSGELLLDNLRHWCAGRPLRNVVDLEAGY